MIEPRAEFVSTRAVRGVVAAALRPATTEEVAPASLRARVEPLDWPEGTIERRAAVIETAPMPEFRSGATATYTIQQLAIHHDRAFVVGAYRAILGRRPDPTGLDHHLALLRTGMSKVELLGRLRYSIEGKRIGTRILGLKKRFVVAILAELPLIGALVLIVDCIVRGGATRRSVRRLEAHLAQVVAQQSDRVAALEQRGDRNIGLLEDRIDALRGG